jgi:hypothetical protein
MAPIIFYVHYNGEMTYGNEGLSYQGRMPSQQLFG